MFRFAGGVGRLDAPSHGIDARDAIQPLRSETAFQGNTNKWGIAKPFIGDGENLSHLRINGQGIVSRSNPIAQTLLVQNDFRRGHPPTLKYFEGDASSKTEAFPESDRKDRPDPSDRPRSRRTRLKIEGRKTAKEPWPRLSESLGEGAGSDIVQEVPLPNKRPNRLEELELELKELDLYLWLSYRKPAQSPKRAQAEEQRELVNEKIQQILREKLRASGERRTCSYEKALLPFSHHRTCPDCAGQFKDPF
jgi:hypothetical protein